MRVPADHPMALTHALLGTDLAAAAVEAIGKMKSPPDVREQEGLLELVCRSADAGVGREALRILAATRGPLSAAAVRAALESPHSSVRALAVTALTRWGDVGHPGLEQRLRSDPSWPVRKLAVEALGARTDDARWAVLLAADDPHWRVRNALIETLLQWGQTGDSRGEIDARLAALTGRSVSVHVRVEGVRRFLRWRWDGDDPTTPALPAAEHHSAPWWDWDPAVLAINLEGLGEAGRREIIGRFPALLGHTDERVRVLAVKTLSRWGRPDDLAAAVALLAEPRAEGIDAVRDLLGSIEAVRLNDTAAMILIDPAAHPAAVAWASRDRTAGRSVVTRLLEPPDPGQLARLASDPDHTVRVRLAERLAKSSPGEILGRLQSDVHPHVRAAALTPDRARRLVDTPTEETSWHVLAAAAKLLRTPLWAIEPEPRWAPPAEPSATTPRPPAGLREPSAVERRPLGPLGDVAPLGISGHYHLPVEGFYRAAEAGIDLCFWEPDYHELTTFLAGLSPSERGRFRLVAGSFEADPKRIRRDAERVLRKTKVERIALFLFFWTRSWARVTPGAVEAVEALRDRGLIGGYSLSTHSRPLAVEALERGWDPVMVRHNAAHRGAEETIFPRAVELGRRLITFNATCYGRMLRPRNGLPPVRAADCYRYAMAQPGVSVCLSAPGSLEELEENLTALRDPVLPPDRRAQLLTFGATAYRDEVAFRRCVRSV